MCSKCGLSNPKRPGRSECRSCENAARNARRDPDHDKLVKQAWRKANPEKEWFIRKAVCANRRSTQKITVADVREVFGDSPICGLCGSDNLKKLSLDHTIPLAKGGPNTKKNCGVLCIRCNRKKGDNILGESDG